MSCLILRDELPRYSHRIGVNILKKVLKIEVFKASDEQESQPQTTEQSTSRPEDVPKQN